VYKRETMKGKMNSGGKELKVNGRARMTKKGP
jgi:hypothetical protein